VYIGGHISISNGYERAVEESAKIGYNTMQFFSRNPRGSRAKELDMIDVGKAKDLRENLNFGPIVAHAPYVLNLASHKNNIWYFAKTILEEDLERLSTMGVAYIVVHPGNHVGKGVEYGIQRSADCLNEVLTKETDTIVLLETMGGVGTEIGYTFEQLKEIIEKVEHDEKIGICLDTCHIFCAGYDIKNNFKEVFEEFHEIIGFDRLKAVHINDSKNPLGSKKDRHANIGDGEIGLKTFENLLNLPEIKNIPLILETPGETIEREKEIKLLRSLVKGSS